MADTTSERMALLRVRVTERVLTDLDALATTWDTTRSEAVRRAVREAAERAGGRLGR